MEPKFKVGDICIWQNCSGPWAWLNGEETTITKEWAFGIDSFSGIAGYGFQTDTPDPFQPGLHLIGVPYELRKKETKTGEQLIRSMFNVPPICVEAL